MRASRAGSCPGAVFGAGGMHFIFGLSGRCPTPGSGTAVALPLARFERTGPTTSEPSHSRSVNAALDRAGILPSLETRAHRLIQNRPAARGTVSMGTS